MKWTNPQKTQTAKINSQRSNLNKAITSKEIE